MISKYPDPRIDTFEDYQEPPDNQDAADLYHEMVTQSIPNQMTTKEFDAKSLSELYLSTDTMIYLLERYIDEQGPVNAIDCIIEVCHKKAKRMPTNWSMHKTLKAWRALAKRLEKVQESAPAETLSNLMR